MIVLTREYVKAGMARAVPGAFYDRDEKAWVLPDPTPRAAIVALKLFPGIEHDYPELYELRAELLRDVSPVDYSAGLAMHREFPRVEAAMAKRGYSLDEPNVEVPGLGKTYQRIDLSYADGILRMHDAFYLGWSRGLGKTLGTACLIDSLDCGATLVVAPNQAKTNTWADELAWATPWLHVLVLGNTEAQRDRTLAQAKRWYQAGVSFVLIVHYEALAVIAGKRKNSKGKSVGVLDGWKNLRITWDMKVLDEGHRIANPDALQSKAAKKVPADKSLILSGSVFQNAWEELFSPLQFLFPRRFKSRWRDFNDRFLDYVDSGYGKVCVGVKEGQEDALREELGVYMVIRDKESKAIPEVVKVPLNPGQRVAYDTLVEECLAELEDGTRVKAEVGIAMLTRLRQMATGLDIFSSDITDSSKLDAAEATIHKYLPRGDDFVVFCWYKPSAYRLAERLAAAGVESFVVTGDVPMKERTDLIHRFQKGERRVFIGTIPTMGESINLQCANHVVRIDRSYNPAANLQAVDRVDRQGQRRTVYLTDIIAEDTVDELVVLPNLANKEALRAMILGGTA